MCRILFNVVSWLSKIYFAVAFVFDRLVSRPGVFGLLDPAFRAPWSAPPR